jgi:hypothetical protein
MELCTISPMLFGGIWWRWAPTHNAGVRHCPIGIISHCRGGSSKSSSVLHNRNSFRSFTNSSTGIKDKRSFAHFQRSYFNTHTQQTHADISRLAAHSPVLVSGHALAAPAAVHCLLSCCAPAAAEQLQPPFPQILHVCAPVHV